jgi:hypothetical protein
MTTATGVMRVAYHQFLVNLDYEIARCSSGSNGLVDPAESGAVILTGIAMGDVHLRVEVRDEAPSAVDSEAWDEVVEVSVDAQPAPLSAREVALRVPPRAGRLRVAALMDATDAFPVLNPNGGPIRLRVRARGRDANIDGVDTEPREKYFLVAWPAPVAPEVSYKWTDRYGAGLRLSAARTGVATGREGQANAEGRGEDDMVDVRDLFERRNWGELPSLRLRTVGGAAAGAAKLDRALVESIEAAEPRAQRAIAVWAARRACTMAGLAELDWVQPALEALEGEQPLPPPFDDRSEPFNFLRREERAPHTGVPWPAGGTRNIAQQYAALPAVKGAANADPLQAALDALYAAAVASGDYTELFDEARRDFLDGE